MKASSAIFLDVIRGVTLCDTCTAVSARRVFLYHTDFNSTFLEDDSLEIRGPISLATICKKLFGLAFVTEERRVGGANATVDGKIRAIRHACIIKRPILIWRGGEKLTNEVMVQTGIIHSPNNKLCENWTTSKQIMPCQPRRKIWTRLMSGYLQSQNAHPIRDSCDEKLG